MPEAREPEGSIEPVVFESITIEAFRGFNERQTLNLNSSVVIVKGPNGLGKTSLFDAIQWLLLGEVARLRASRLRQSDEYIVNQYREGDTAFVSARVRVDGQRVFLRRSGDRNGSTLTWTSEDGTIRSGAAAEAELSNAFSASPHVDLEDSLSSCGLLQQDAARQVLETKPRDRFTIFSKLLGLSQLESFEQWSARRSKDATTRDKELGQFLAEAESRLQRAESDLEYARERSTQQPAAFDDARKRIATLLSQSDLLNGTVPSTRSEAVSLVAASDEIARLCSELNRRIRVHVQRDRELPSRSACAAEVEQLKQEASELNERAETYARELNDSRRLVSEIEREQEELDRFVSAALAHLQGPSCPVCEQQIDEDQVRTRLHTRTHRSEELEELRISQERASSLLAQAEGEGAETSRRLEQARRRQEVRSAVDSEREDIFRDVSALDAKRASLNVRVPESDLETLVAPLSKIAADATELSSLAREYVVATDASIDDREARALAAVQETAAEVEERRRKKEESSRVRAERELLNTAAQRSRLDVVAREFSRLSPIAQDIYSRMNPHPTFRDIELVPEVFRAASTATPRVVDSVMGVEANPLLIFSAAQTNMVALSYVVALNWATADRVPTLLLDDPLQAMDDINVLGFSDLCRHLRRHRQIIVSTHERRFAQLLERKLAPRSEYDSLLVQEFNGWDRTGPQIVETRLGPEQGINMLGVLESTA